MAIFQSVIKGLIPAVNIIKSLIINVSSADSFYLTLWTIYNSGHSIDHLLNNIKMFCFYFKLHRLTPFKICLRETIMHYFLKRVGVFFWMITSIYLSLCLFVHPFHFCVPYTIYKRRRGIISLILIMNLVCHHPHMRSVDQN